MSFIGMNFIVTIQSQLLVNKALATFWLPLTTNEHSKRISNFFCCPVTKASRILTGRKPFNHHFV